MTENHGAGEARFSSVYLVYMWEGIRAMARGGDARVYLVILALATWTLVSIFIPYLFRELRAARTHCAGALITAASFGSDC
jgi:hypothetical protein